MDIFYTEKKILATLSYFDLFSYPLTKLELSRLILNLDFLKDDKDRGRTLDEVLLNLLLLKKIEVKFGFYFLFGRGSIVFFRLKKYRISLEKYQVVKKMVNILANFPFIKAVSVCNSLSYFNAHENSDIDLFIITSPKRLWISRFLVVSFLAIFNLRPKGAAKKNKLCLSFWVSEDGLFLKGVTKKPYDIYFYFWISSLRFLLAEKEVLKNFWLQNNWILEFLPKSNSLAIPESWQSKKKSISKIFEFLFYGFIGDFLEKIAKFIQFFIRPQRLRNSYSESEVVLSDKMIKMHTEDKRDFFRTEFENKFYEYNIK